MSRWMLLWLALGCAPKSESPVQPLVSTPSESVVVEVTEPVVQSMVDPQGELSAVPLEKDTVTLKIIQSKRHTHDGSGDGGGDDFDELST